MKKLDPQTVHEFDAHGASVTAEEHVSQVVADLEAENERLRRVIILQQRRFENFFGKPAPTKPTLH